MASHDQVELSFYGEEASQRSQQPKRKKRRLLEPESKKPETKSEVKENFKKRIPLQDIELPAPKHFCTRIGDSNFEQEFSLFGKSQSQDQGPAGDPRNPDPGSEHDGSKNESFLENSLLNESSTSNKENIPPPLTPTHNQEESQNLENSTYSNFSLAGTPLPTVSEASPSISDLSGLSGHDTLTPGKAFPVYYSTLLTLFPFRNILCQ